MEYGNINQKVASEILAHKDVDFTNRTYKYLFEEQMKEAKKAMNENILSAFKL